MSAVKAILGEDTLHLEPAKGNEEQNREYCMKDGNYREFGEYDPEQGKPIIINWNIC